MSKNNVFEFEGRETSVDPLTELLLDGAQKLVFQAVQAELYACLEQNSDRRTEDGHAGVVRNGYQPEREIQTGIGPVTVKIPKVRAKTGEPVTFQSALVPPYVRKTRSLEGAALVVSEGDLHRRDGCHSGGPCRAKSKRPVSQHGVAPEADVGTRIPELARRTTGQESVGLYLGRRRV
jgi:hypothetical protein